VAEIHRITREEMEGFGSKLRCIRSTPTEIESTSENDLECFAKTGVNTPGTMSPNSGRRADIAPGSTSNDYLAHPRSLGRLAEKLEIEDFSAVISVVFF
jgi:hypothetical protein